MDKFNLDNILEINYLENELDLERAVAWQGKLRWMAKEDESLIPARRHLRRLIEDYESHNWKEETVTDRQIAENDTAQAAVTLETNFVARRKELIRERLKKLELNQQDLATLLGHSKGYMSELINGLRPFSKSDIFIVHKLLRIELERLMLPTIGNAALEHIQRKVTQLSNPRVRFNVDSGHLEKAKV